MPNLTDITILSNDKSETISTEGYLLLYLKGSKITMSGKIDIAALTPIISKILLERMGNA